MPGATTMPAVPSSANATTSVPRQVSDASSDEELILALRDGSELAFTTLFHRYTQALFGFFSRRVSDSARAEELTQETFIALFRAAKGYEPRAPFRSYLYAIAFRILKSERRKSIFRATFFGPAKAVQRAAVSTHTEDSLWVRRALAKLDSTDREIVMLREYQQLSYDEIAALLEIPLNTVRSRLFRARLALRDLLVPPDAPIGYRASPAVTSNDEPDAGQPTSPKKGTRA